MNNKFSTSWLGSKNPGKQRKYLAKAPLHLRGKFLNVNVAKNLRKEVGRAIQVRKDDTVKVTRGKFAGQSGKVLSVNLKKRLVEVEGIQAKKMDGSKVNVKMQPSNLQITALTSRNQKSKTLNSKTETKKEVKK